MLPRRRRAAPSEEPKWAWNDAETLWQFGVSTESVNEGRDGDVEANLSKALSHPITALQQMAEAPDRLDHEHVLMLTFRSQERNDPRLSSIAAQLAQAASLQRKVQAPVCVVELTQARRRLPRGLE